MICANQACNQEFTPATHNQIYCSSDCCKIVTNENIKRKYHEKKRRLNGEIRLCACGVSLSRYNKYDVCASCEARVAEDERAALALILNAIAY